MTKIDKHTPPLDQRGAKDLKILSRFIACWCKEHHKERVSDVIDEVPAFAGFVMRNCRLCADCQKLLAYAATRRRLCPLDPKPACKDCPVHCYKPDHRAEIRKIMRFSGRYFILRGRLDLLWHYFF